MSQINLNPAHQIPLAATHPLVPQTAPLVGMSTTAKVISILALAFFATFAYIVFSRWNTPTTKKPDRDDDHTSRPTVTHPRTITSVDQEKLQREIAALNGALWEFTLSEDKAAMRQSFIEATDLTLTTDLKDRLITFVAELRFDQESIDKQLSSDVKKMTDPARNRIAHDERERVDREAAEAAYIDYERTTRLEAERGRMAEMNAAFDPLFEDLQRETQNLDARYALLQPADLCCSRYKMAKGTSKDIDAFQERFKVTPQVLKALDEGKPTDQFQERIVGFNAEFSEEKFQGKRTDLQKAYETYLTSIKGVLDRLAWKKIREAVKDSSD